MQTIYKYPLSVNDKQDVHLPVNAVILTVQSQKGIPCLWALVNPKQEYKEVRTFHTFGTGHPFEIPLDADYNPLSLVYIGTYQISNGDLIFHLFEEK